ncbi:ribose 5-phosphate isomerase B [Histomonas meleagridis]|uniref:ribose 5-phosphate isomerase B n=1 Tax=Histomonas meleagridis TaxID=135588 RepID=UPI0035596E7C|nr:ribose 5-phosphate isomerase B [Histomonas meleagridis]KAH0798654.1 ribose 5-phosphate isomerase B [Histomonas meleagridis]
MKIVIGCDHGGFDYKDRIVALLKSLGHEVIDVGTNDGTTSVDYPDYAEAAAKEIVEGRAERGILICGTGIGISIAANKVKGIRCAVVHDHYTAQLTRQHNDANMIAFGARVIGIEVAYDIVRTFLTTDFEGGRHAARIAKITAIENRQ